MHSSKIVLLLLLFVAGCGSMKDDLLPSGIDKQPLAQQGTTGPSMGQNAPDFTVRVLGGGNISLKELGGKIILLNFFATY